MLSLGSTSICNGNRFVLLQFQCKCKLGYETKPHQMWLPETHKSTESKEYHKSRDILLYWRSGYFQYCSFRGGAFLLSSFLLMLDELKLNCRFVQLLERHDKVFFWLRDGPVHIWVQWHCQLWKSDTQFHCHSFIWRCICSNFIPAWIDKSLLHSWAWYQYRHNCWSDSIRYLC